MKRHSEETHAPVLSTTLGHENSKNKKIKTDKDKKKWNMEGKIDTQKKSQMPSYSLGLHTPGVEQDKNENKIKYFFSP